VILGFEVPKRNCRQNPRNFKSTAIESLVLSHFLRQTGTHFAGKCSNFAAMIGAFGAHENSARAGLGRPILGGVRLVMNRSRGRYPEDKEGRAVVWVGFCCGLALGLEGLAATYSPAS
jgi:hypothetical protein